MNSKMIILGLLAILAVSFSTNVPNCANITSSGSYVVTSDLSGAPNYEPLNGGTYACIAINASNVILDCNGHSITGPSSGAGIYLDTATSNITGITVKNCPNINSYNTGIYVSSYSSNNVFDNITLNSDSGDGISLMDENDNTNLSNIHANNCGVGIYSYYSNNNQFRNITINTTTSENGIDILYGTYNTISDSTIFNTLGDGILIMQSDQAKVSRVHFYGANENLHVDSGSITVTYNITDAVFDGSSDGSYSPYVNLSIYDTLSAGESYSIYHSSSVPSPPSPSGTTSFDSKYITIRSYGNSPSIGQVVFSYPGSEVTGGGYNESSFFLGEHDGYYDGPWTTGLGESLDTGAHTITIESLAPSYTAYGIFNGTEVPCPVVDSDYTMTADLNGAPNHLFHSETGGLVSYACVKIVESNLVFDCNGHSIVNDGTSSAAGIVIGPGVTNVTVENCADISDYTDGVILYQSSDNKIINTNATYNSQNGFELSNADNNVLVNDYTFRNSNDGFLITDASGGPIGSYNNISDSTAINNRNNGFELVVTDHNVLRNNDAEGNNNDGFYVTDYNGGGGGGVGGPSSFNYLYDNTATNSLTGFEFDTTDNDVISGNNASENRIGFLFRNADYMRVVNNDAFSNHEDFAFQDITNTLISDNLAHDSTNAMFKTSAGVGNCSNVTFSGNELYNNPSSGLVIGDGYSGVGMYLTCSYLLDPITLIGNSIHDNFQGLYLQSADTVINGGHFYNNSMNWGGEGTHEAMREGTGDLIVDAANIAFTASASNLEFDSNAGEHQQYSTVSFYDDVADGSSYFMTWVPPTPIPIPSNHTVFNSKYLDIGLISGSNTIESLSLLWDPGEVGPFDPSKFELWRYDDATNWTQIDATLNENNITTTDLELASEFSILMNGTIEINSTNVQLYGANIDNQTNLPRWAGDNAGNESIEGGNISHTDINGTTLTDRWAAFFGNVTGRIMLGSNLSTLIYAWEWTPSAGGVVCASANGSLSGYDDIVGATGLDVDTAWSFPAELSDSGVNTFTGSSCSLDFGATSVGYADYADTGPVGGFETCTYKMAVTPTKPDMLFCSAIDDNGTLFDGTKGNFELIVPTTPGEGATETYYLYVNLN